MYRSTINYIKIAYKRQQLESQGKYFRGHVSTNYIRKSNMKIGK